MALECARRMRRDPGTVVRLATSHRCVPPSRFRSNVDSQQLPDVRDRLGGPRAIEQCVCGGRVRRHIATMLQALDRLERDGFVFPERRISVLAARDKASLGERIAKRRPRCCRARAARASVLQRRAAVPDHRTLQRRNAVPLIDGGAFDWVARLTSNRRAVYVASAFGSQLAALTYRAPADT